MKEARKFSTKKSFESSSTSAGRSFKVRIKIFAARFNQVNIFLYHSRPTLKMVPSLSRELKVIMEGLTGLS